MLERLECFNGNHIESSVPDQMPIVLVSLSLIIGLLILGCIFVKPITAFMQRRYPNFAYDGETLLLWGGLVIAAFGFGLVVMYLVLRR
jgi:hypothetical protein